MPIIIKHDKLPVEMLPENGEHFELKEMQDIVDGYIEILYIHKETAVICNEEGMLLDLPINKAATLILRGTPYEGQVLFGNIILTTRKFVR